jgi:cytochrome b
MPQTPQPQVEETVTGLEPRTLWDWPTRVLHWSMVGLFTGTFSLALLASEHSPAFVIHAALGILLGGVVLLRLLWGIVGSKPSRFGSFLYSPMSLVRYVRDAVRGVDRPTAGHNPGSS